MWLPFVHGRWASAFDAEAWDGRHTGLSIVLLRLLKTGAPPTAHTGTGRATATATVSVLTASASSARVMLMIA